MYRRIGLIYVVMSALLFLTAFVYAVEGAGHRRPAPAAGPAEARGHILNMRADANGNGRPNVPEMARPVAAAFPDTPWADPASHSAALYAALGVGYLVIGLHYLAHKSSPPTRPSPPATSP